MNLHRQLGVMFRMRVFGVRILSMLRFSQMVNEKISQVLMSVFNAHGAQILSK